MNLKHILRQNNLYHKKGWFEFNIKILESVNCATNINSKKGWSKGIYKFLDLAQTNQRKHFL